MAASISGSVDGVVVTTMSETPTKSSTVADTSTGIPSFSDISLA
jgi:hypothetical protein